MAPLYKTPRIQENNSGVPVYTGRKYLPSQLENLYNKRRSTCTLHCVDNWVFLVSAQNNVIQMSRFVSPLQQTVVKTLLTIIHK